MAFTQNKEPTFPLQPQASRVQIVNADAQAYKVGYTAGANGSKIFGVIATSSDTSNRDIAIVITNSAVNYVLGMKTVPLSSGIVAGTPSVNLIDTTTIPGLPVDNDGNPFIYLISGDTLTFQAQTSVTAAKIISIHVFAADF